MNWPLRRILFVSFCLLVLALGGLLAYSGARLIRQRVSEEAQARVRSNLETGRAVYHAEEDAVLSAVRLCSKLTQTSAALGRAGSTAAAQAEFAKVRAEAALDFVSLVDAQGQVRLRTTPPFNSGDSKAADPLVMRALNGQEIKGTRLLTRQELTLESPPLAQQAYTVIAATPKAKPRPDAAETSGLALVAAAPVRDSRQAVVGVVYAGRLLNRNYAFVDRLREAAFGGETFEGKRVGTVTIFQRDLRIATNVVDAQGNRAIGTLVSAEVHDRVLENGKPWVDRAFVVNDWFRSAYEPILDVDGKIVGIFYMGILERKYRAIEAEAVRRLLAITVLGMAVATGVAYVLALKLATPIGKLADAARHLASAGPGHEADVAPTCREVKELIPGVSTASVKHGLSRNSAISLSAGEAHKRIREGVSKAIGQYQEKPLAPLTWPGPYVLEKRFFHTDVADNAASVPGAERVDSQTVRLRSDDILEIIYR